MRLVVVSLVIISYLLHNIETVSNMHFYISLQGFEPLVTGSYQLVSTVAHCSTLQGSCLGIFIRQFLCIHMEIVFYITKHRLQSCGNRNKMYCLNLILG